ncbi:MAG: hypothetical protein ACPLZD_09565 [Candidatus Saccharicenans sp.]
MKKTKMLRIIFFLILGDFLFSSSLAATTRSEKTFYAQRVLNSVNVNNPENILGEPDGRFAEIKPGGELTVVMEQPVFYHQTSDDGFLVVKGDTSYGLAGLFQMNEEGKLSWLPLSPGKEKNGFKLGTDPFVSLQRISVIKIVNDDEHNSLFVDAIAGLASGNK